MSLDTVKVPSLVQLSEVAAELGFALPEADLMAHLEALIPSFAAYNELLRRTTNSTGCPTSCRR
jgi:hypothetical protein